MINSFLIMVYTIVRYFLLGEVDINNCARSIAFGGNTVVNGWYLQVIMLFYFAFIVILQANRKHLLALLFGFILLYMAVCFINEIKLWWYISSLAFPCGCVMSQYLESWNYRLRSKRVFLIVLALFVAFYLLRFGVKPSSAFTYLFMLSCLSAYEVMFSLLVFMSSIWISYKSNALGFMGQYYLEIYVLQGLLFIVLRNNYWILANPWLFALLSIIGTLVLSILFKPVFTYIQTQTRKLVYA